MFADALPLQESYSVKISFESEPSLWDTLFGPATLPRVGITICTDVEPPSLSDLFWAYLAAKARYEFALEQDRFDKALEKY